jgi:hypothetical protein
MGPAKRTYLELRVKQPTLLSDFNQSWNFSTDFLYLGGGGPGGAGRGEGGAEGGGECAKDKNV